MTRATDRSARVVTWNGAAAVELRAGATRAVVIPELGMLIAAFVVDGFDFVARPGGLAACRAGHTTAVPLLYPWANRLSRRGYAAAGQSVSLRGKELHTDGHGLPLHGTMNARPEWDVAALRPGRVRGEFDFGAHPDLLASFPYPHRLSLEVAVTPGRLRVSTAVHATGGVSVPVSFGWHPYWRVPGPRDSWTLALPAVHHVRLDRGGIPTGSSTPEPAGAVTLRGREWDDLYALPGRRSLTLTGRSRGLRLESDSRFPWLQVYAPRGRPFCCLEPMTAPTDALVTGDHPVVQPGRSWSATFRASAR